MDEVEITREDGEKWGVKLNFELLLVDSVNPGPASGVVRPKDIL